MSDEVDQAKLSTMEAAFEGRGDISTWTPALLDEIDDCFVNNFYDSRKLCDSLFFPGCADNLNRFGKYCTDVDRVLQTGVKVPPYARTYFAYAMLWQTHGHKFPIPLGTKSVIEAVDTLAKKYRRGLREVSYDVFCYYHALSIDRAYSEACYVRGVHRP